MFALFIFFTSFLHATTLYIAEERATLWGPNDPGFTFRDCINPTDANLINCERRVAWPVSNDTVTPTPSRQVIRGVSYVYVVASGRGGWVEESTIDSRNVTINKNTHMYSQAGLSFARCKQADALNQRCSADCNAKQGSDRLSCLNNCSGYDAEVKSCQNKQYLTQGSAITAVAPNRIRINNENYFFVSYNNNGQEVTGWIYEGSLSRISLEQDETATEGDYCTDCDTETAEPEKSAFEQAIESVATQGYKSSSELERFACLHSDSRIYGRERNFSKARFCAYYKNERPSLQAQIAKAAQAFALPEAVITCTLLTESAMFHNPAESDHYRGMGQFGAKAVADLKRYLEDPSEPYKNMWSRYTKRSTSDFNDRNIRDSRDVEAVVGAVAMYAKWFLVNRIPKTNCRGCSGSTTEPNQKDIDMFIAGYNWKPYGTAEISHLSSQQLRQPGVIPPPKETKGYFKKMEKCMRPGQFNQFTHDRSSTTIQNRGEACRGPC